MKDNRIKKANSEPFIEMEIKCPACGKKATHLYLKNHVFQVEKREDDLFISKYSWIHPGADQYNLYSFFFWFCPFCKFTEDRNVFLQNQAGTTDNLQKLIRTFQEKSAGDKVVSLLAKYIKYPVLDYYSLLSLHLLATYIQFYANDFGENIEKIAKYFLRTTWIFRTGKDNIETKAHEKQFNEFMKRYELLQSNAVNLLASLEETYQWLKNQMIRDEKHKTETWLKYRDTIETTYRDSIANFDKILKAIQTYNSVGVSYKKDFSPDPENPSKNRFHEFDNYLDYLISIKKLWQELPLNEFMATQRTIHYYQKLIHLKTYQGQKLKQFHIYKLIIALSEKSADYQTVLRYADQLLAQASRFRNTALRRKRNYNQQGENSSEIISIENYIKKSVEFIEFAKERRSGALTLKLEQDTRRAEDIFTQHRDLEVEKLKEIFEKSRIDKTIIQKYLAVKERENKKGIFQIFRF